MNEAIAIQGSTAPEFTAVKEAFAQNFADGHEVGASLNVTKNGKQVVDLWAGHADPEKTIPWERDTLVNVWSTTKGVMSMAIALLVDRSQLNYSDKVAQHWPEFAQGGKEDITVAELLSHQAGLCGMREPTVQEDFYDWDKICNRLAVMKPFWPVGQGSGYHAITFGYLAGELLRRIDGRTPGNFIREELCEPLDADFHVGLAEDLEDRLSLVIKPPIGASLVGEDPPEYLVATMGNPVIHPKFPHHRGWRAAEIPAANGHGTAEALAKLYTPFANGGLVNGEKLIGEEAIKQATTEQCTGVDKILGSDSSWGIGFSLNKNEVYGPNKGTFGHGGFGGSLALADPSENLAIAYTMNQMGNNLRGDPRTIRLIQAIYGR